MHYWVKEGVKGPLFQYFDDVTNINGTLSTADNIFLNTDAGVIGIHSSTPELSVTIFPNPASDIIHISTAQFSGSSLLSISDFTGKTTAQLTILSAITEIDISNYSPGIYFIKLENEGNQTIQKFIVE